MSSITHLEVKVAGDLDFFSAIVKEILTEGAKDVEFLTLSDGGAGEPSFYRKLKMNRVSLARDCFRSLPLLKLMNMCLGSKKTLGAAEVEG